MDKRLMSTTLLLSSSITILAPIAVAPALPGMEAHFGGEGPWVKMMLTLPAVAIALGAPLLGFLCDRFGKKGVLLFSLLGYAVGGGSGFFAPSLLMIALGRLLLGLGVAGVMTSTTALIGDLYEGEERTRFFGVQAFAMGAGGMVLTMAGGALAELGWRFPFLLYLLAVPMLPLVSAHVRDAQRSLHAGCEPAGDAPLHAFSTCTRSSDGVRQLLFLAPVFLAAIYSMAAFFFSPVHLPFYVEERFGAGPTASGLVLALGSMSGSIVSLGYGVLKRRLGFGSIYHLTMAILGLAYFVIGLAPVMGVVYLGGVMCGFSSGLVMPNLNLWVTNSVSPALRGTALGVLNTFIHIGQFLSPLLVAALIFIQPDGGLFALLGMFMLIMNGALFLVVTLRQRRLGRRGGVSPAVVDPAHKVEAC